MRRVLVAPPRDIFWGGELIRDEILEAKRRYSSEDLLEGTYFIYICTLIAQLIDVVASDFILPAPPPKADPAQPLGSRGGSSQAS